MKKRYAFFSCIIFAMAANAQDVIIPDISFKTRLLEANTTNSIAKDINGNNIKIDANNDSTIQVSEALNVYELNVNNTAIIDMAGVGSFINLRHLNFSSCTISMPVFNATPFTNLTYLNGASNNIATFNIAGLTNLEIFYCSNNPLTSLTIAGLTNLRELYYGSTGQSSLDVSGMATLEVLDCYSNSITNLDLSGLPNLRKLSCGANQLPNLNFTGLTALKELDCASNGMTSFNIAQLPALEILICNNNAITALDLTASATLRRMDCSGNPLTSLNIAGVASLEYVECRENGLTSLNLSGLPNLDTLNANNNLLAALDVSGAPALETLSLNYNQLMAIDTSGLANLFALYLYENQLATIDLSANLQLADVELSQNILTSINVTGLAALSQFYCSNNQLAALDFSGCTGLWEIYCWDNQLTTLDLSETGVQNLSCYNNQITSLFLKNGAVSGALELGNNPLEYICGDDEELAVIQGHLTLMGISNCTVNSYCSFTPGGTFYTIQGNHKWDINGDGCQASDPLFPHLKFSITDGTNTGNMISSQSGNFSIPVAEGTHTLTPVLENPAFFSVSPASMTVTFPTQASPFTQNFCVAANGVHPDLEVTLIPLGPARPGFDAFYKIAYKNKGNQLQSGSVNLTFEDAVLDLVVSNPAASTQAVNNLVWNFTNLQPFETRVITLTLNVNAPSDTPPVNNNDVLDFTTSLATAQTDESPADNTFILNQIVVGSYDPNGKTCLEGATISPEMVGQYVHYVIRFENTGTFAAENIVVRDIIDTAKLDIATLVPLAASHDFTTRISEGNKVEFIFQNINLPFNDANNDGFVAFKIKTKPTLVIGNTFSNTAGIHFDYNFPIVTDPAITTVAALAKADFQFSDYLTLYPNPVQQTLNIQVKNEIVLQSISIYNILGQLVIVIPNAASVSAIDVSGLKTGNYFLKINSDKGVTNTKFVKN